MVRSVNVCAHHYLTHATHKTGDVMISLTQHTKQVMQHTKHGDVIDMDGEVIDRTIDPHEADEDMPGGACAAAMANPVAMGFSFDSKAAVSWSLLSQPAGCKVKDPQGVKSLDVNDFVVIKRTAPNLFTYGVVKEFDAHATATIMIDRSGVQKLIPRDKWPAVIFPLSSFSPAMCSANDTTADDTADPKLVDDEGKRVRLKRAKQAGVEASGGQAKKVRR
jgi:hypothetical protein